MRNLWFLEENYIYLLSSWVASDIGHDVDDSHLGEHHASLFCHATGLTAKNVSEISYFVKQTLNPINQSINQTMLRFSPLTVDMMISQLNPHSTGGSVDTNVAVLA